MLKSMHIGPNGGVHRRQLVIQVDVSARKRPGQLEHGEYVMSKRVIA
jgi:hypothetical protein